MVSLTFGVTNSGEGTSSEDTKLLFQKFEQAIPKTHIHYGGHGK